MRRALLCGSAVVSVAFLAGCGDDTPPPPQDFPALHYEYLTPIRLNVADIQVQDQSSPPDGDLSIRSPAKPEQAMEQMAHDRLIAAGGAGTATFVVTEANITHGDGGVTEHLGARIEITNATGGHAGFAEAHVTRTETQSNGDEAGPANLYELTRQSMQDMNVELEYQVRHTLHDWVVTNGAVEPPVSQAPLGPDAGGAPVPIAPAGSPAAAGVPGGPTPLAPSAPAAAMSAPATTPEAAAPAISPPPGYLSVPSGTATPTTTAPDESAPYGSVPPSSQAASPYDGTSQTPTGY